MNGSFPDELDIPLSCQRFAQQSAVQQNNNRCFCAGQCRLWRFPARTWWWSSLTSNFKTLDAHSFSTVALPNNISFLFNKLPLFQFIDVFLAVLVTWSLFTLFNLGIEEYCIALHLSFLDSLHWMTSTWTCSPAKRPNATDADRKVASTTTSM